jgi:transcriptional regulator with XRE-family HTH domain
MKKAFKKLQAPKAVWLRVIRKALGLTAQQLAKRAGSSRVNITRTEKNEVAGSISAGAKEVIRLDV